MALPAALLTVLAACVHDDGTDSAESELDEITITFTETTATALPDQACGTGLGRGCYTNYAITADLDNDGKLDLVMANGGEHFFAGTPEPQAVYFGSGTGTFSNAADSFPGLAPSLVRQIAVADFDGDGNLDIYFPAAYGNTDDQLFMQLGARSFANEPMRVGGGRSRAGAVHAGDIDNDGDMDLVIADWGAHPNPDAPGVTAVTVKLLVNDGAGHFTDGGVLAAPLGNSSTDIDLQDVNGDFALDIVLTQRNGQSRLYLNDGKGGFTDVTVAKAFPRKQGPYTFNAELCDIDKDGDLDLFFDGGAAYLANHTTQVLINDGTGRFADETVARIPTEPRTDDNQVKCADVDSDGDLDLVVASLANPSEKLFRNVGDATGIFKYEPLALPPLRDPTLSIDFGDFDGDGKPDLMTAQGEVHSRPFLERIFKNNAARSDTHPPVFRKVERPIGRAGKPTILRLAVSDAHTSETGQHVKSVGFVYSADGGAPREVKAVFAGGDLFRAVLPSYPAGTRLSVRATATDRVGNKGTGEPFDVLIAGDEPLPNYEPPPAKPIY